MFRACLLTLTLYQAIAALNPDNAQGNEGLSHMDFESQRALMVKEQIEGRGITDRRVLAAMRSVPRHLFVPENLTPSAYEDSPLLLELQQTISQPFIVARMSEAAQISPQDKILEIGTGSGYQAAILSLLGRAVFTIEILEPLGLSAKERLKDYANVTVKIGDGNLGWPEHAPFDAILVTAGAFEIPPALLAQLKPNGHLIMPVGIPNDQVLVRVTKKGGEFHYERLDPVRFVPLVRQKTP